ncbi:hypothetical protein BES34_021250 [Leptospira inadai serovar Lyme]|uniref:Uncharacterized protein n=1 Tax=Leptospira inadai serovar Lyme TaxID=293084 RepID=A0ABX4YCM4_9LEPT|nr:hypothetical protein BES34_021250 [Leptospira inadai serovar Lyme]
MLATPWIQEIRKDIFSFINSYSWKKREIQLEKDRGTWLYITNARILQAFLYKACPKACSYVHL